jgi:hypothetical protein
MGSIPTSSFEPLLPESVDLRWIDYFSGRETSPYCNGSAVSMPFPPGTPLEASEACPPGAERPPDGPDGPDETGAIPAGDPGANEPGFP